jgi:hypothetical protein
MIGAGRAANATHASIALGFEDFEFTDVLSHMLAVVAYERHKWGEMLPASRGTASPTRVNDPAPPVTVLTRVISYGMAAVNQTPG